MRVINRTSIPDSIANIKKYIVEQIIHDLKLTGQINFEANDYLKRLRQLNTRAETLISLVAQIEQSDWLDISKEYALQTALISNRIIDIPLPPERPSLYEIMKLLFNECLFSRDYWKSSLVSSSIRTKMEYKELFFRPYGWTACPYCDLVEDDEYSYFEIDHLLPLSRYPLLGINEWNLFPCCRGCNSMHTGKGDRFIPQYNNYFDIEMGLHIDFSCDNDMYKISSTDRITENHLDLIQINKRINSKRMPKTIKNLRNRIYMDLKRGIGNRNEISDDRRLYYVGKVIYEQAEDELSINNQSIV